MRAASPIRRPSRSPSPLIALTLRIARIVHAVGAALGWKPGRPAHSIDRGGRSGRSSRAATWTIPAAPRTGRPIRSPPWSPRSSPRRRRGRRRSRPRPWTGSAPTCSPGTFFAELGPPRMTSTSGSPPRGRPRRARSRRWRSTTVAACQGTLVGAMTRTYVPLEAPAGQSWRPVHFWYSPPWSAVSSGAGADDLPRRRAAPAPGPRRGSGDRLSPAARSQLGSAASTSRAPRRRRSARPARGRGRRRRWRARPTMVPAPEVELGAPGPRPACV